jgi:hypothetical protein
MKKGPDGKMYKMLVANGINKRAQVWNGTAYKTSHGVKGLTKSQLMKKNGRLVSRKASKSAGKNKNLGKYQDFAKKNKGTKGLVLMRKGMVMKNNAGKTKKRRRKPSTKKKRGRRCRTNKGKFRKC